MSDAAVGTSINFGSPGLAFRLDTDARALIAAVTPDPAAQAIDEACVRAQLEAQGYGALRYLPDAVTPLLAHYNAGMAFEIKLAECVDASLQLEVSPDGLEAYLDILPAAGGTPIGIPAVLAALAENGIGEGILTDAIDAAVAAGVASKVVAARGVPPVHGEDGWFESLIPEVRSRVPRVDESGHTDYRDLGDILVVHAGDNLMLRHPPTAGKPGLTLFGEKIEANDGFDVMFSANLPGTAYAPDNPNLLQAAITGQPVVIRGGIVDMATLEANGSIVVKGGVMGSLGRKNVEDQHVQCAGCLNAAYVQQAKIDVGDSIFIDDMAMQSDLTAINHIRVGNKKRGHIIGGHVQATLSITARVIGSPNRVRTQCEIGVNPLMHKQLLEMCKQRDGKETQLLEVSKLMDFAAKNPGKLRPEMIEKARATAAQLSAEIAAMREEQDGMTKKIDLSQQSRVNIEQAIYEGVEVQMGSQRFRVTGEHGPCAVGLTPGGLELLTAEDG